tara:strand:+ start:616 stop:717 length:102 start_codon:yes stop_codon:yes gene_type:complete
MTSEERALACLKMLAEKMDISLEELMEKIENEL